MVISCSVPGVIVFWSDMKPFCNKPVEFLTSSGLVLVWKICSGPIFIVALFVSQLRLCLLAVKIKLDRLRNRGARRVLPNLYGRNGPTLRALPPSTLNVVWTSLLASMIVVFVSSISVVAPVLDVTVINNFPSVLRLAFTPVFQHLFTPLVYFIFFPQFRAVTFRWFSRTTCRRLCGKFRWPTQNPKISIELIDLQSLNKAATSSGDSNHPKPILETASG